MSKQNMKKLEGLIKAYQETGNVHFLLRASALIRKGKANR